MDDHLSARRAEAKQHRGVWFDARADKFVAEVYSLGNRHFLGHFDTADAAATAYAAARIELPTGRVSEDTFVAAFQTFLDTAETTASGAPERDEVLTYKGQEYTFEGVVFRVLGGRKRPFYNWLSFCSVCGDPFNTLTATSPAGAKGITRNCEHHRRGGVKKARATDGVPEGWTSAAEAALAALSLVAEDFTLADFLAACHRHDPDLPRAFNRFLLEHETSPVELKDGRLRPRNP